MHLAEKEHTVTMSVFRFERDSKRMFGCIPVSLLKDYSFFLEPCPPALCTHSLSCINHSWWKFWAQWAQIYIDR